MNIFTPDQQRDAHKSLAKNAQDLPPRDVMSALDELLAKWRDNPDAGTTVALCTYLGASPRTDLIQEVGANAQSWHQEDAKVMLAVGRMYLDAGLLAEAQAALVTAGKANPSMAGAYRFLGEVLLRRGDAARAEKVLARSIQLGHADNDAKMWHDRAAVYVALQKRIGMQAVADEVSRSIPKKISIPPPSMPPPPGDRSSWQAPPTERAPPPSEPPSSPTDVRAASPLLRREATRDRSRDLYKFDSVDDDPTLVFDESTVRGIEARAEEARLPSWDAPPPRSSPPSPPASMRSDSSKKVRGSPMVRIQASSAPQQSPSYAPIRPPPPPPPPPRPPQSAGSAAGAATPASAAPASGAVRSAAPHVARRGPA